MRYEELRDFRDTRRKRWEKRHGAIKPTEQYSKTRTESVVEDVEIEMRGKYITPSETFEEEGSMEEVEGSGVEICEELRERGYKGSGIKKTLNRQIWFLLDKGYTYRGIAYELGCDKVTVYRHKCIYRRMK